MKFLNKIKDNKIVQSLYVKAKHIYMANVIKKKDFTFDILGKSGNYTHNNLKPYGLSVIYENEKNLIVDKDGNIYTISTYEDKIEKWDKDYKKVWSKYLFSGHKIKYKKMGSLGSLLPSNSFWYNKIVFDNAERIYILSGKRQNIKGKMFM